jgi:O-antigen ligase
MDEGTIRGSARVRVLERPGEWLLVALLWANLWWTTLCLGGYRPETMVVSITLNAAALALWLLLEGWCRPGLAVHWAALATLPFLLYAAGNAAWVTPVPWLGWRDWLEWAQMAAVFWVALHGVRHPRAREALFWGVAVLGVVAVAMSAYQHFVEPTWLMMGRRQAAQFVGRASGPFGIPNSLAALLILLLPPMLALALQRGAGAMQRVFCGYLVAFFSVGLLLTVSRGAWLALAAALAVWPLLAVRGRARRWLASLGVIALLALAAIAVYHFVPNVQERIDSLMRSRAEVSRVVLWRAGWRLFQGNPVLGTGAGSYDVLFERYRPERFWDRPEWAHNDYLNTLSDYGVAGLLLSFGVAAVIVWWRRKCFWRNHDGETGEGRAEQRMSALRTGIAIGLLAFGFHLFVEFNLKIPALAQAAALLAALVAAAPGCSGNPVLVVGSPKLGRFVSVGVAIVVIVMLFWRLLPFYRAEALRYGARERMNVIIKRPLAAADQKAAWQDIRQSLEHAVREDPANASAWSDLSGALIECAREDPPKAREFGREAAAVASQALACSEAVPEFWLRRAMALDLQDRWRDAWADYVRALTLAPNRTDIWYCYAYHLSLRDPVSARMALATSLNLDPWNEPALALQRRLDGRR